MDILRTMGGDLVDFIKLPLGKQLLTVFTATLVVFSIATILHYFTLLTRSLGLSHWGGMVAMVIFWGLVIWIFDAHQCSKRGKQSILR